LSFTLPLLFGALLAGLRLLGLLVLLLALRATSFALSLALGILILIWLRLVGLVIFLSPAVTSLGERYVGGAG